MPRIGITGHMNLTPATVDLIVAALQHELSRYDPAGLVGVSCLAEGADAIFAHAVLEAGGRLEALLPAPDYRDTRVSEHHLPIFDTLVTQAHKTRYVAEASSPAAAHTKDRLEDETKFLAETLGWVTRLARGMVGERAIPAGPPSRRSSASRDRPRPMNPAVGSLEWTVMTLWFEPT